MEFPFSDSPNAACIVCKHILRKEKPILFASHDEEDGMWQFMCGCEHAFPEDACIIGLAEALELDSTISSIANIPCGYMAERESATSDWTIIKE